MNDTLPADSTNTDVVSSGDLRGKRISVRTARGEDHAKNLAALQLIKNGVIPKMLLTSTVSFVRGNDDSRWWVFTW